MERKLSPLVINYSARFVVLSLAFFFILFFLSNNRGRRMGTITPKKTQKIKNKKMLDNPNNKPYYNKVSVGKHKLKGTIPD